MNWLANIRSKLNPANGIALFTDGSAYYKDRCGAWAFIAVDAFLNEYEASEFVPDTTNSRTEMMAWIEGLNALHEAFGPCEVAVYSDSQYVGLGATDLSRHRKANLDLWEQLDQACDRHTHIRFVHVRGHDGHHYNERVDRLASRTRRQGTLLNADTDT